MILNQFQWADFWTLLLSLSPSRNHLMAQPLTLLQSSCSGSNVFFYDFPVKLCKRASHFGVKQHQWCSQGGHGCMSPSQLESNIFLWLLPLDPAGDSCPPDPLLSPRSKFLATPLNSIATKYTIFVGEYQSSCLIYIG